MRVPTVTQIQKIERSRAAICTCIYKVEPYRALVWCNKCKGYQKHSRFIDRKV
jgi:hypothetical protein